MIKTVNFEDFIEEVKDEFAPESLEGLHHLYAEEETAGIVLMRNLELSRRSYGKIAALAIGPNRTYKTLEELDGKWMGDAPSRRLYPVLAAIKSN